MSIFNYYPYINYDNQKATHLLCKAEVLSEALKDKRKFYTYIVKEGERADTIAYKEYDDSNLEWIIYLINNIVDPYKDWPLDDSNFIKYMESKYNTKAEYLTSTNLHTAYYYYKGLTSDTAEEIAAYNYTLTADSYNALSAVEKSGWEPKSVWDHENEINESKREIYLLRPAYISEFKQKFKDLFING